MMKRKIITTTTKEEARPVLVPRLRFPEFREAEGWSRVRLGDTADIKTGPFGSTLHQSDYVVNGTPIVTVEHLSEGGLVHKNLPMVSAEDKQRLKNYVLRAGDIVFSRVGSVDRNSLVRDEEDGWLFSGRLLRIRTNLTALAPSFLSFYFQLESTKRKLRSVAVGQTMASLNTEILSDFQVLTAHLAEQKKIAECLSSVDELMAAQARKVDALKTHKKGLMQQLFPREGETEPRLRFPEFQNAGEWVESPLSNFILSLDAGVSVNSGDRPANKTEFGVLKTSAVTNGVFEPEVNKVVFAENELSRLKESVSGGTIIISRMNTPALVGANAYVESSHENLFLPDRLWAAKPREGVSMRFLAFILGSDKGRTALSKLAKGSSGSMKNITKPEVLAFSVMAPSPAEQQRIASCLTSLDALITAETKKLEALKTHKKGLMQQLFPSPEVVEA